MPVVALEKFVSLQKEAACVRNICILAHVDHGKTSLTDALIATNGIISPKLAGKIRYLDSRPDEQLRGITMESSAISLYFSMLRRTDPLAEPTAHEYLINLIDSPGHIDFSSEVSTASRLCDGALVLVDAVEGVCSQTVAVLRQTWTEKLKPLLVINKVDRLITEWKLSPTEAYHHLAKLLEQVNAVIGSFFQGDRMEEDLQWREKLEERMNAAKAQQTERLGPLDESDAGTTSTYEEQDDEDLYFAPEKNNVIFSSAIDGWAFTVRQFAAMYEKKLGIKRSVLEQVLWGNYYLDPKTKRVLGSKHLKGRALKPMFVQLVLESIWAVYDATTGGDTGRGDAALIEKITNSLSLKIPVHILRSRDVKAVMSAIFLAWLPLSTAVLVSAIEYLPSPLTAQKNRIPNLLKTSPGGAFISEQVKESMRSLLHEGDSPTVAFVSKMVSVHASELPQNKKSQGTTLTGEEAREMARRKRAEFAKSQAMPHDDSANNLEDVTRALAATEIDNTVNDTSNEHTDTEQLVAFTRTYSGQLRIGDSIYVLPPKFTPEEPDLDPRPQEAIITGLYLMMGRGLEPLNEVPPGVVCGITGLEGKVLKSATLCSQLSGAPNLAGVAMGSAPIVRVALEPTNPADLDKMISGMKLLEQSDPCARYEILESGEHVILTAGELHLERCLKDLRERFAKCGIQPGEPIVPYRETIVKAEDMALPKSKDLPRGTVSVATTSTNISLRLTVKPLPSVVTSCIKRNAGLIRSIHAAKETQSRKGESDSMADENEEPEILEDGVVGHDGESKLLKSFQDELETIEADLDHNYSSWRDLVKSIISFGPRNVGQNVLFDMTANSDGPRIFSRDEHSQELRQSGQTGDGSRSTVRSNYTKDRIVHAFQLATAQGPMCHEPVEGIAVFIDSISTCSPDSRSSSPAVLQDQVPSTLEQGRLTSEIIKAAQQAIHAGFMDWSPRLLLAMYSCEIQCATEVLGRAYSTLSRLHATITSESMKEGTPFYSITALLPVASSFTISSELLKSTSGAAQPQLQFHGFELLDEDPYWIPQTEEELEDFGTMGDRQRWSKMLLDGVRRRKGLAVKGDMVIKEGEKQKTLKR